MIRIVCWGNVRVYLYVILFTFGILGAPDSVVAQTFVHPGINQTAADLALMKKKILAGEQPYAEAFSKLKAAADADFTLKAHTHVLRGPFGRPNIGGDDLSKSASRAYDLALVWYVTNDKQYAKKAIEVLNAWSPVLWDFDYNDAKLLAAWTGHLLCNAAEILRYTNSGWQQSDIDQFTEMLNTVYYPLIRYYFPQANGNWDGAIIHSILSIAIFTNNREMFNNGIEHFLHGPVNGSLFKYIYPSGQCQESARDQGHVQLGLGEFAGAAQVAYTQGVDLFSIGDNRIAAGYEYTASFLAGKSPHAYGVIAERAKSLRDDYEYVYRHYSSKGIAMPFSKIAVDSMRLRPSRQVLTSIRTSFETAAKSPSVKPANTAVIAGAGDKGKLTIPSNAIFINPGESIQKAVDESAGSGKWIVLKEGIHTIPGSLKMRSGITLSGEGIGSVIFLNPPSTERDAIVNGDSDLHDIVIRDLVIEGGVKIDRGTDPNSSRSFRNEGNRGGIIFRALTEGQMKKLSFINLTVRNCTYNGVFIAGAADLNFTSCNFEENGSSVIPGPKLQHNLLLSHCAKVNINNSRFDTSPYGSGIAILKCKEISVTGSEIARNAYYGIIVSESKRITLTKNLVEGNDKTGIMLEYLYYGTKNITVTNNRIWYNGGYGVEAYASKELTLSGNLLEGNGKTKEQQKLNAEGKILME